MKQVTFITGNAKKAEYLEKLLDIKIAHKKINLDEIQSLDLKEVVEHKVKQAYEILKSPVLVEDVSLEFEALKKLPGTFIKFFLEELGDKKLCELLNNKNLENRKAIARCTFGYFDGENLQFFEGSIDGKISEFPKGENGYGWDKIFIPYFSNKTNAELNEIEYEKFYTTIKPFAKLKEFLEKLN